MDGVLARGGDCAAVDDDDAVGKDAIAVFASGFGGESAGAVGLAIDGQNVVVLSTDANAIVAHAHRLAVGQDDVHVAIAVNRVVVTDVVAHDVPRGRAVAAEVALRAGKHGGVDALWTAVRVDVIDRPRRCGREQHN